MVGEGQAPLSSKGIFLQLPGAAKGWIEVDGNKLKVIDDLGYKSEEKLETPLFFTTDPQGKRKASQVEAFDNGTAFSSMAAYLFSPLILWLGAQIGKNASISDRVAGGLTLIELERLINVTDRILSTYVLARLVGDTDKDVYREVREYRPPEVPPEMPKEAKEWGEALPEKYRKKVDELAEKIKKYAPEEIEKLKRELKGGIDNLEANLKELKKYLSQHPELMREYEAILRKIVGELTDYKEKFGDHEDLMAVTGGILYGDLALRKYKTKNKAKGEIEKLYLPKGMDYCAKMYIETKDPMEVIQAYNTIYKMGRKKYDSEGRHYGE